MLQPEAAHFLRDHLRGNQRGTRSLQPSPVLLALLERPLLFGNVPLLDDKLDLTRFLLVSLDSLII